MANMNIVVLGTDEQKKELLEIQADKNMDLHWFAGPDSPGIPATMDACIDLGFENNSERLSWLKQLNCRLIVVNSVIATLKEIGEEFVRINGWNTFLQRGIIEASCNNESLKPIAEQLFLALGRKTEWTPDIPGFITARVVSCIINEAFFALEEKVSEGSEIDIAMKLGTNYPYGPFEWVKKIGVQRVHTLLEVLEKQQNRYKPSALLKETTLV
jgi:3-hydroxybutyryl-CoA dehydrogenase